MGEKSMCFLRKEKSWVQPTPGGEWFVWTYNFFKCDKEPLAVCQLAHMDAPRCPGKCGKGCASVQVILIGFVIALTVWAVLFIYKAHAVMWKWVR